MNLDEIKALYLRYKSGGLDLSALSDAELHASVEAERKGGLYEGELAVDHQKVRELSLSSPSYFATEVVDPYYKRHYEPIRYACMDEAIGPYLCGETVSFEGQTYDPKDYLGLILLFSRFTYKSSMAWVALLWCYVHWKVRLQRDARAMYVHQVQKKAIRRGENIRDIARNNDIFRGAFPEFAAPKGEWDTKGEWNWPCFTARGAGEASFTAYGETSEKTGGHHSPRIVDDWETEHLKTVESREDNYQSFLGMDPLIDDAEDFCPYLICGTTYFFSGTHERLVRDGGYLVWKVPAHRGSPKVLFDLASLNPRDPKQKKKIDQGIKKLEKERSGDLNFPKRLDWRKLYMRARGQGRLIYPGQMLQNPTPEGETRFNIQALSEVWVDTYPGPDLMWIYIRCDPAISEKRTADETAFVVGGVCWDGTRISLDGWVGREKQPVEIVRKGFEFARKWQDRGYVVKSIGYENTQYQDALVKISRFGIPEREATEDMEQIAVLMRPCPVVGIERPPDTRKQERIASIDGPIGRREFKILKSNPIGLRQHEQLSQFPFGRFDILDATHDLWVKTQLPPKPIETIASGTPLHVLRLMERVRQQKSDGPRLCGTNLTVDMQSWN